MPEGNPALFGEGVLVFESLALDKIYKVNGQSGTLNQILGYRYASLQNLECKYLVLH